MQRLNSNGVVFEQREQPCLQRTRQRGTKRELGELHGAPIPHTGKRQTVENKRLSLGRWLYAQVPDERVFDDQGDRSAKVQRQGRVRFLGRGSGVGSQDHLNALPTDGGDLHLGDGQSAGPPVQDQAIGA